MNPNSKYLSLSDEFFDLNALHRANVLLHPETVKGCFISNFSWFLVAPASQDVSNVPNQNVATAIGEALYGRMSDKTLHYHTPIHVMAMLDFAQKHDIRLSETDQMAIWFHDSIYDIHQKDNERNSVDFFKALVGKYLKQNFINDVEIKIMATARHLFFDNSSFEKQDLTILDLDLSNFAYSQKSYEAACEAVESEYVPAICGSWKYLTGRADFLKQLIAKGYLYRTDAFNQFEDVAMDRIKQTIGE